MTRAGRALCKLRLGPALGQNSGVISPLVLAFYPGQKLVRLGVADSVALAEAIGQREQERNQSPLVFRVGLEDIETNAFRFGRLVEETVTLRFFEGRGDGFFGKGLELRHNR